MSSLRQSSATSPTSPVARNVYSRASVDVESGEVHQNNGHNGHKRPYTPGASPREILAHQHSLRQLPSPSQTSPHGSRFMDGYRRRMRQASLNLPSETQLLDEDLGFPPVCSPPPEVFCGSISGNHMRNRSNSEAHPSMRMRSSHSLGNGSGCGGLLVFFPTSPSSSSNNSGHLMHRRESHTDETAEDAIVWSTSNDMCDETIEDEVTDDVSMKDVEMASPGAGAKSLKRPPDLGVSPSTLVFPPTPAPDPFTQRSPTPSALLVFLAATPSQSDDTAPAGPISPRRRWSSQKESHRDGTRSAPCSARRVEKSISLDGDQAIDRFFMSHRTSLSTIEQEPECSSEQDHPSPLPSKGLIRKFRKRILSTDKAPSSSNSCCSNGQCSNNSSSSSSGNASQNNAHQMVTAANSYSPRQRPLFVDTQMANHLQDTAMKRRSPVSQVVDFVRGRNRTYSLQLSSSPMCSPQSVAARASASCDAQPANSPNGRRQTMSGRVHRASFTGGTLKSFDSGLDLSSPTINHTALLIKEVGLCLGVFSIFRQLMPRVKVIIGSDLMKSTSALNN
ncbi:unnamed protein product [Caenorhabditis brenneri]